jgi:hypothetical protein
MKNNSQKIKIEAVQFSIGNFTFDASKFGKSFGRVVVTIGTDREYFTDFQAGDANEVAMRIAQHTLSGNLGAVTANLANLLNSIS